MRLAFIGLLAAIGLGLAVPANAGCRWNGYGWDCGGVGIDWGYQSQERREEWHRDRERERWHERHEYCEHHPWECRR